MFQLRTLCCKSCKHLVDTVKSKAKAVTRRTNLVDSRMFGELKKQGTIILGAQTKKYYCISCAIHRHQISQRNKNLRKTK